MVLECYVFDPGGKHCHSVLKDSLLQDVPRIVRSTIHVQTSVTIRLGLTVAYTNPKVTAKHQIQQQNSPQA